MSENTADRTVQPIRPDSAFLSEVVDLCGEAVSSCYHCRKCTNGCPLAFAMDVLPNQVIRMVQLGLVDEVLRSKTIWVCASCQQCTTRCPNDIDIARVMDCLRQLCIQRGITPAEENVFKFHDAFLKSVRRHGRVFEAGMLAAYKMRTGNLLGESRLALGMLRRGKLKYLPERTQSRGRLRELFDDEAKE